jgi:hypothetical protein
MKKAPMTNPIETRKEEWLNLVQDRTTAEITDEQLEKIFKLEDKLSLNNASLSSLQDDRILSEAEFNAKLSRCYEVFLEDMEDIIGKKLCKAIYDYNSGETLEFLTNEQNVSAMECQAKSISETMTGSSGKYWDLIPNLVFSIGKQLASLNDTANEVEALLARNAVSLVKKNIDTHDLEALSENINSLSRQTKLMSTAKIPELLLNIDSDYRQTYAYWTKMDKILDRTLNTIKPEKKIEVSIQRRNSIKNKMTKTNINKVYISIKDMKKETTIFGKSNFPNKKAVMILSNACSEHSVFPREKTDKSLLHSDSDSNFKKD